MAKGVLYFPTIYAILYCPLAVQYPKCLQSDGGRGFAFAQRSRVDPGHHHVLALGPFPQAIQHPQGHLRLAVPVQLQLGPGDSNLRCQSPNRLWPLGPRNVNVGGNFLK